MTSSSILDDLIKRYPKLKNSRDDINTAFVCICNSYENNGKLLVCGNGGSASDSDHIVGELMKSFSTTRRLPLNIKDKLLNVSGEKGEYLANRLEGTLSAISLNSHTALNTAISNDIAPSLIFAQQVVGYGNKEDVILGISTSGLSENVCYGLITAKAMGLSTIGLTGKTGGDFISICDVVIRVDASETPYIQELHLPVYHALCKMLENHFFN